jgi:hypothetical protein
MCEAYWTTIGCRVFPKIDKWYASEVSLHIVEKDEIEDATI